MGEPQFWANKYGYGLHNAAHLKTPSGDTVSVEAAKVQHHQLKAVEYAKKAYIPYAGVVVSPVANAVYNVPRIVPATYAAAAPVYTNGVYNTYGIHHLGKREAESDSQYYTNTYGFNPYYTRNVYNANVYGRFPYGTTYANVLNRFHY